MLALIEPDLSLWHSPAQPWGTGTQAVMTSAVWGGGRGKSRWHQDGEMLGDFTHGFQLFSFFSAFFSCSISAGHKRNTETEEWSDCESFVELSSSPFWDVASFYTPNSTPNLISDHSWIKGATIKCRRGRPVPVWNFLKWQFGSSVVRR